MAEQLVFASSAVVKCPTCGVAIPIERLARRCRHPTRFCSKKCACRAAHLRRRAQRRSRKMCLVCGKLPPIEDRTYCDGCKTRTSSDSNRTRLIRVYGMTPEAYRLKVEQQEGRCAICGCAENDPRNATAGRNRTCFRIDHNHSTGKVRGLLCGACNSALGLFRDDGRVLAAAIEYLKLHGSAPS